MCLLSTGRDVWLCGAAGVKQLDGLFFQQECGWQQVIDKVLIMCIILAEILEEIHRKCIP